MVQGYRQIKGIGMKVYLIADLLTSKALALENLSIKEEFFFSTKKKSTNSICRIRLARLQKPLEIQNSILS